MLSVSRSSDNEFRVVLVSDDEDAENVRVGDALTNGDHPVWADAWNATPIDADGKLRMEFDLQELEELADALESEFPFEADCLRELSPRGG